MPFVTDTIFHALRRCQQEAQVYYPHCGREMALADDVYSCAAGEMTLGRHLHAVLTERFPERQPRPSGAEVGARLTRWYCPGCDVPLGQSMACGRCGKSIEDLLFPLVELHPHERM